MTRKLDLREQIARAQQVVEGWSDEKRSMMRLQGTDNFHERMINEERADRTSVLSASRASSGIPTRSIK
jgi:hypothetical protein